MCFLDLNSPRKINNTRSFIHWFGSNSNIHISIKKSIAVCQVTLLQDLFMHLPRLYTGRNILHLCAAMCTPPTNKEPEEITTNSLGAALDAYSASNRDDIG